MEERAKGKSLFQLALAVKDLLEEQLKRNMKGAGIRTVTSSKLFSGLKMLLRLNVTNQTFGNHQHSHSKWLNS